MARQLTQLIKPEKKIFFCYIYQLMTFLLGCMSNRKIKVPNRQTKQKNLADKDVVPYWSVKGKFSSRSATEDCTSVSLLLSSSQSTFTSFIFYFIHLFLHRFFSSCLLPKNIKSLIFEFSLDLSQKMFSYAYVCSSWLDPRRGISVSVSIRESWICLVNVLFFFLW